MHVALWEFHELIPVRRLGLDSTWPWGRPQLSWISQRGSMVNCTVKASGRCPRAVGHAEGKDSSHKAVLPSLSAHTSTPRALSSNREAIWSSSGQCVRAGGIHGPTHCSQRQTRSSCGHRLQPATTESGSLAQACGYRNQVFAGVAERHWGAAECHQQAPQGGEKKSPIYRICPRR